MSDFKHLASAMDAIFDTFRNREFPVIETTDVSVLREDLKEIYSKACCLRDEPLLNHERETITKELCDLLSLILQS